MVRLLSTTMALALVVGSGGCKAAIGDAPGGDGGGGGGDGALGSDGALDPDAPVAIDAALGPWSAPTPIPTAATAKGEDDPVLSSDGLELIFAIDDGATSKDLFVATRATTADAFGAPAALTALNTANADESPRLSADDKTLYWGRNGDIVQATRSAIGQPFGAVTPVAFANTAAGEKWFDMCASGYYLVSRVNTGHGNDLFEGHAGAATTGAVAALDSDQNEISTQLSRDCLTVTFASNRPVNGTAVVRLYTATRASEADPWSAPVPVTDFGATADDEDLWQSPSGRIAVFATTRGSSGTKDLYMSTR